MVFEYNCSICESEFIVCTPLDYDVRKLCPDCDLNEILKRHNAYADFVAHCIYEVLDTEQYEKIDYLKEDILAYIRKNNY